MDRHHRRLAAGGDRVTIGGNAPPNNALAHITAATIDAATGSGAGALYVFALLRTGQS